MYYDEGVKLDFVTADSFFPTSWDSRGINGAAFVSRVTRDGRGYILAQTQQYGGGDYVIENRLYKDSGAKADMAEIMPGLAERSVISGLDRPLFVYFRAGAGSRTDCPPLGASVFAGAEDTLRALDTVFDSMEREFVLGRKRIIVPYYAVRGEYDEKGDIKRYFDVNDEVFQAMSTSDTEELKITDNTAALRVTEHTEAISELLDLLCMQAGLSDGALSYSGGTIRTAAEVVSRSSRTYRTQAFYRRLISQGLSEMVGSICAVGKMAGLLSDGACESASAMYGDGAAEDDGTRVDRALKLYASGVISRARALSQIYGVSLEEAKSMERTDFDNG